MLCREPIRAALADTLSCDWLAGGGYRIGRVLQRAPLALSFLSLNVKL
ncbi:MAG: hypothetical protein ACK52I_28810 [Pseudomonadota bacterium]|jgi:hypothetical protein